MKTTDGGRQTTNEVSSVVRRPSSQDIRSKRRELGIAPSFYRVDTCAAEFESSTPYLYSNYDGHDESEIQNLKT